MQTQPVTRLAPSPTGALHLGNAFAFVVNWAIARAHGWRIVLRIEDLDTPRTKAEAVRSLPEQLAWLGLDWDEGPYYQANDLVRYRDAMSCLARRGLVYTCSLTRRELEQAAHAPHAGEHELRAPETLRPSMAPRTFDDEETNWRFMTPPGIVKYNDGLRGLVSTTPNETVGDFVVWTKQGQPAYQLAVVVDDDAQGVTHVVRGADLIESTGRQLLLYDALDLTPAPEYWHTPLIVGPDGRRLAKRHGDTRLSHYREAGVSSEAIIGLIASWCEIVERPVPMTLAAFADQLDTATIPPGPIACVAEDDRWLLQQT